VERRSPQLASSAEAVQRHFNGGPTAVREARGFVHGVMAGRIDKPTADDLTPILSELATNAVRHFLLAFDVVIEAERPGPSPEDGPPDAAGASRMVRASCARWGVHMVRNRTCVWCGRTVLAG
jgi:hypothetical protein